MSKGVKIGCGVLLVVGVIVAGFIMWGVGVYNDIVKLDEAVTASWGQVENQYQRRMDLVPNLVNTVKGAASFEKDTFIAVAEARANAGQIKLSPDMLSNPSAFQKFQSAQDGLSSALSRLLVTVEKYPELKANENFLNLQAQLEGTENRISVERKRFNQTVQTFNTKIKTFPANLIAGFGNFQPKQYFSSQEGADKAPKVQF